MNRNSKLMRLTQWVDIRGDGNQNIQLFGVDEVARYYGITQATLRKKMRADPSIGTILPNDRQQLYSRVPTRRGQTYAINNELLSIAEIKSRLHIHSVSEIKTWIKHGELEERYNLYSANSYQEVGSRMTTSTVSFTYARINHQSLERFFQRESKNGLMTLYRNIFNVFVHKVILRNGLQPYKCVLKFSPRDFAKLQLRDDRGGTAVPVNIPRDTSRDIYRSMNINIGGVRPVMISFERFKAEIEGFKFHREDDSGSDPILNDWFVDPLEFQIGCLKVPVIGRTPKEYNMEAKDHVYYVLGEPRNPIHTYSCFFDSMMTGVRILYKGGSNIMKNEIIRKIKNTANIHREGVMLHDVKGIVESWGSVGCRILGYPRWDNEKKMYNETVVMNIDPLHKGLPQQISMNVEVYLDSDISHFYSVIDRKGKDAKYCKTCGMHFYYVVKLKGHEKICGKKMATGRGDENLIDSLFVNRKDVVNKSGCVSTQSGNHHVNHHVNHQEPVVEICYDLETVSMKDQQCVTYAAGWSFKDPSNSNQQVYKDEYGECSIYAFVKDWGNIKCNKLKIIAFNGSRFDLWLVLSEAYKQKWESREIVAANGIIYSLTLVKDKQQVSVWDPALHFKGSLTSVARSFHIPDPDKVEFNHDDIQNVYENDGWTGLERYRDKSLIYLRQDVMILNEIVDRIPESNKQISTPAGMAWKNFKSMCDYKYGSVLLEDIPWFRQAVIGGRTEVFGKNGVYIEEDMEMIDVVSLYPSVMYDNSYPIGQYVNTPVEVTGKLGIYNVHVNFQRLPVVVGRKQQLKQEKAPIDWKYTGEMDVVLSSVTIDMMRRHFGNDSLTVGDGVYWEYSTRNLFKSYIDKFLSAKIEQDQYKESEDPDVRCKYNPVVRENAKLMLNSLYGKLLERLHTTEGNFVSTLEESYKIRSKLSHFEIYSITGELEYICGERKEPPKNTSSKPLYLGIFVLDYSKRTMYDNVFSKVNALYTDTDSALIRTSDYKRLSPEIFGKGLGKFSDDTDGEKIKFAYLVEPKCYLLGGIKEDGERFIIKARSKGVSNNTTWVNTITGEMKRGYNEELYKILTKTHPVYTPEDIYFNCLHFKRSINELSLKKLILKKRIACERRRANETTVEDTEKDTEKDRDHHEDTEKDTEEDSNDRIDRMLDEQYQGSVEDVPDWGVDITKTNEGDFELMINQFIEYDYPSVQETPARKDRVKKLENEHKTLQQNNIWELRDMLKSFGLKTSGKKSVLIERLNIHYSIDPNNQH